MGRAYSDDLRERVVAAALSGHSCRAVAGLFSVSFARAVKWPQRLRQARGRAAKPQGRRAHRRGNWEMHRHGTHSIQNHRNA